MKHIKFIHHANESWCGETIEHFEPHFRDIEQVLFHKLYPNSAKCCKECLSKIVELLSK